jgi:tRNA dimethylallyltransferase
VAQPRDLPPLLVLVGPTGVGKTAAAVRLAARVPLEAVSADSRQVYRGLDIGTGKPTPAEQATLPHHLIDVADPTERYHAARFRRDALAAIAAVRARGRLPIVVGGTGLYVRVLLRGLAPAPPAAPALRAELEAEAARKGPEALHRRLAHARPDLAARIHPRDRIRLVRALEIETLAPGGARAGTAGWAATAAPFRLLVAGLTRERALLNRRLAERCDDMLARGLLDEVRALRAAGVPDAAPGMTGIGYRECVAQLAGRLDAPEARRRMVRDTQRYAKRQMTWFARDAEIRWIDVDRAGGLDAAAEIVGKLVEEEGLIE